jgi:hypothetical protein
VKKLVRFLPLALSVVVFVFLFVGSDSDCTVDRDDIYVHVDVLSHPVGGSNVDSVSCTFQVKAGYLNPNMRGPFDPAVKVNSAWHNTETRFYGKSHYLEEPGEETFTVSKTKPSGTYFDKPMWLQIWWYDDDGLQLMTSDTAWCQGPGAD